MPNKKPTPAGATETQKQLPPRNRYNVDEFAAIMGVHTDTVRRAIKRGDIRATRIGSRILIPMAEAERLGA